MAQQTQLTPLGLPGEIEAFSPKSAAPSGAHPAGDYTQLTVGGYPGRRYLSVVPTSHDGEFTWLSPAGYPGGRYSFRPGGSFPWLIPQTTDIRIWAPEIYRDELILLTLLEADEDYQ